MNRRIAGRVKHARKRAQRKADIRAGRRVSMQDYYNGRAAEHNHNHTPEGYGADAEGNLTPRSQELVETMVETPVSTHQLVDKENGDVVDTGTEYEMRKLRAKLGAADYSVRKVK